jgi:hypothetical protein
VEQPKIFDQQNQEQDWNWLVVHFGPISLERATASQGSAYRVVKFQDAEGAAVQIVNVKDQEDHPLAGLRVVRYWPDAPALPNWPPPISMWHNQGVYGDTNVNGDIGYGMGHGDYYFPPGSGASAVWVADQAGPSDLVSGLGMLGGTDHRHIDVYYQLLPVSPPVEPPVKPPITPPVKPPVKPPDVPPDERWQKILDKLDQIIALLEKAVPH